MENKATLILFGKNIFLNKNKIVNDSFVAINGSKIIAIDSLDKMSLFKTATTKIINARDGLILPGFHDCHVHLIDGGLFKNTVQLGETKTEKEAAKLVGEYARETKDIPWILGYGWYHIYWDKQELPTKETLDEVISDRPVFLQNEDGHGAWVNSKALEICNITKETKDPEFGKIFRDENGEPTGYLDELAMMLCAREAYNLPAEYEKKLLMDFMKEANKYGVTSVNDMRPLFDVDLGNLKNYEELEKEDKLSVRINFSTNLFNDLNKTKEEYLRYQDGKLNHAGVKQFIDGVAISYTAVLLENYSDNKNVNGEPIIDVKKLEEAVIKATELKLPVHLHAAGDGSTRIALDAYEKGKKVSGNYDVRHSVEHIDNVSSDDIDRFKGLNIVASMQPEHMAPTEKFEDNPYVSRLGEERCQLTWAVKSLMDSGAIVAFGTDYPVVGINPMINIHRAVTRKHDDGMPNEGWTPKQKVSIEEALDAYTLGSAKMVNKEDKLGTIDVGKYADITILEENPFDLNVDKISNINVKATICDGEVVYEVK